MVIKVNGLADFITANAISCSRRIQTSEAAVEHMGISKSYLYKLTTRLKSFFEPTDKMYYFNRIEIEQWLLWYRFSTEEKISKKAQRLCLKKGGSE